MNAEDSLIAAGLHESTWGVSIIKAQKSGFTEKDCINAGEWTTCACGKVDRHVEMVSDDYGPLDQELNDLGIDFAKYVGEDRVRDAAYALIAIEKRSIELLNI
tara:strand:+ start:533 stop:841 length:309 start_codon:yes stop_codon:yes gene_type:complete